MHQEPSRIRSGGTIVTKSSNGDERIAALRSILANQQYAKIDGVMVDLFSASAVIRVFDAINDQNKEKLKALPIGKMVAIAFKLLK